MRYLALLRGINVGGNNIIKMVDLKACFEDMGFQEVSTYIQSGNVLFTASGERKLLEEKIERGLSKQFSYTATVVVLNEKELKEVMADAPKGFGDEPEKYRYDVIFLKHPLKAAEAIRQVSVREGVDETDYGKHALYFWRLTAEATKSHLSRIISSPIYKNITIRNWNTTRKLAENLG